jgi:ATP-binding cassette, subfamily B, bacterial MsbA
MQSKVPATRREETRRLFRYVVPHLPLLIGGLVLLAVMAAADGLVVLSIRPAVDIVLTPSTLNQRLALFQIPWGSHPTIYLNWLVPSRIRYVWSVFSIALLFLFGLKGICEFFGITLIQYVGLASITDLRNHVYEKVVQQPVGFFEHNPVGRVMSAIMSDIEQMRSAFSDYLADFCRQCFTLAAFILVLLVINWEMALASALLVPVVVWPIGKLARRIRQSTEKSRSRLADLSQLLQETISGNRVVKAFGMEHFEIRRFREAARKLFRENMRWTRALATTSPLMDLLGAAVVCMILDFARDQIRVHKMTTGIFFAFVFALFRAYEPVKRLGSIYQLFLQAIGISAQVFAFIDLPEEVLDAPGARPLPRFSRSVEFANVSFAYDSSGLILRNIDLNVRAGTVVAIVGSSGAGKTTLVNLLPRFYTATAGRIRIDGADVRNVSLRSLREQMAIVTQETILFNDTVWNNLCYGRPDMSEGKVFAASQAALAHDFILQLPEGYHTLIGDRGQRLSGGQRQRLAIARALLKDAPILILDEATSELDSESELLVQNALNNLMIGRTVFVIAHRLSTIRRADIIAVLDNGTICERGAHEDLLARGGVYARLYEIQFRDLEPVTRAEPS